MEFASCVQAAVLDADVVFVPAALYAAAGVHTPSTFRVTIPDVRALPISVPRAVPVRVRRRVYHRKSVLHRSERIGYTDTENTING